MTTVLVPIDGSARALSAVPWAGRLAGADGRVLLLRAVPAEPAYAGALLSIVGSGPDAASRIRQEWQRVANADLDEAERMLARSGARVERLIGEGEPEDAIVTAAQERGVDLIVMASHGRGAIGRAVFGSVADRVARTSPVPVLILRVPEDRLADEDVRVHRIIVPLDGSPLAAQALPMAASVAKQLGAPVHVVRAVEPVHGLPISTGTLGPSPVLTEEITDRIWQEAEAAAQETVKAAIQDLQREGVDADGATLSGSPFFAISDATEPDDLIVLTSHGRGGVQRWLLGSVAEKLVREAPAPVLLVPAAGRGDG